ncbi:MAG: EamA family transporter RarD [Pseudomonadota bacterium]
MSAAHPPTSSPARPDAAASGDRGREGLAAALCAYLMWGILPVYFKLVAKVDALEILAHRIVWAVPFGVLIISLRGQRQAVWDALRHPRTLALLATSAAFIAINWLVYIRAVLSGNIFQASLGYYINPLVSVLAGVLFFGERLNRTQVISVGLATVGVLVLATVGRGFPLISITLALTFTVYGVIRKAIPVGAMPGLFVETLVLLPVAGIYLASLVAAGTASLTPEAPGMVLLLLLAGPITVLPLLLFALAARRLPLATLGFVQFLAPTLQFLMGLLYGESLTLPFTICFACIWSAVCLFAFDAWQRRPQAALSSR